MALSDIRRFNPFSRQNLGNAVDLVGTRRSLPDLGISELIAGGNTVRSGTESNTASRNAVRSGINYFTNGRQPTQSSFQGIENPGSVDQSTSESQGLDQIRPDPFANIGAYQDPGGSTGGGGRSGGVVETNAQIEELNGRLYDLSDPSQANAYYEAANASELAIEDQTYQKTLRNIGRSRENLASNTKQALEELRQRKQQLQQDKENYFAGLEKQGRDLVTGKSLGDVKRGNYFSGLGNRSFQSAQATSQDFADNQFAEGLAENQKAGAEAENRFKMQFGQVDTKEENINKSTAQQMEDLAYNESDAKFQRDNFFNQARGKLVAGMAQRDANRGVRDYSNAYKLEAYSPINMQQPDLSGVKQFTDFQTGQAPAGAGQQGGSKFSTLSSTQQAPLENYFGFKPDEKAKNRISSYFAGKAA